MPDNNNTHIESLVNEVLSFANLENADDMMSPDVDAEREWIEFQESSFIDVTYNLIGSFDPDGFGDSQAKLRELLNILVAHGGRSAIVDLLIRDALGSVNLHGSLTSMAGDLRLQLSVDLQSNDQWWAVGIAILLHAGMGDRVRQCGWDKCVTYFVDWPGRKGQRKLYCCPGHQNAERQRRHREKAKRERG